MNAALPRSARWLSPRSLMLHVALLVALPLCAVAAWWQVERALSGNTLSWLYVFEWPAFAVLAVWFWWVMITASLQARSGRATGSLPAPGGARPAPADRDAELLARRAVPLSWEHTTESAPLRAYNDYLRQLADRPAGSPMPRRPRARAR